MSTDQMHLEPQQATQVTCATCGSTFKPRRAWARFCGTPCRNAFHGAEARLEKIREAAPALYEALRQIADGYAQGGDAGLLAQAALKDLKPPVEPKALLEKASR